MFVWNYFRLDFFGSTLIKKCPNGNETTQNHEFSGLYATLNKKSPNKNNATQSHKF